MSVLQHTRIYIYIYILQHTRIYLATRAYTAAYDRWHGCALGYEHLLRDALVDLRPVPANSAHGVLTGCSPGTPRVLTLLIGYSEHSPGTHTTHRVLGAFPRHSEVPPGHAQYRTPARGACATYSRGTHSCGVLSGYSLCHEPGVRDAVSAILGVQVLTVQ
jgi:hypothetical protein